MDVEQNLPKKKEIILYANMTNKQKEIQDHLINKTFNEYVENSKECECIPKIFFLTFLKGLRCYIAYCRILFKRSY